MTAKQSERRLTKSAKSRRNARTSQREKHASANFSQRAAKSFLITLGLGAALLLVAAIGIYFLPDPSPVIRPIGVTVAALTALAGGFAAGRIHGHAPAVCGLLNGMLLTALMLLLSLFLRSAGTGYGALTSTLLHAMIPLCSLAGATVGVRKKATPKRRQR